MKTRVFRYLLAATLSTIPLGIGAQIGAQQVLAQASTPPVPPTPVVVGQVTSREKVHRTLFPHIGSVDLDAETKKGKDLHILMSDGAGVLSPGAVTLDEVIQHDTCNSDAAIVGVPRSSKSQLTESKRWVFSELDVEVSQVLRDTAPAIAPHDVISVVKPGGAVLLNGHVVEAYGPEGMLKLGQSYLMFIKYITETNSFRLSTPMLPLSEDAISIPTHFPDRRYEAIKLTTLTSLIQGASTQCRKK